MGCGTVTDQGWRGEGQGLLAGLRWPPSCLARGLPVMP